MVLNLPLVGFKVEQNGFGSAGGVAVFLKKSLTALCLKTCIKVLAGVKGLGLGGCGQPWRSTHSLNEKGKQRRRRHLWRTPVCGSTNRLFFCLPQLHLHSSFLAACTQAVESRETPFGMSDKHTFEMTCSFHALEWHKVRKCVSAASGESKGFAVASGARIAA